MLTFYRFKGVTNLGKSECVVLIQQVQQVTAV